MIVFFTLILLATLAYLYFDQEMEQKENINETEVNLNSSDKLIPSTTTINKTLEKAKNISKKEIMPPPAPTTSSSKQKLISKVKPKEYESDQQLDPENSYPIEDAEIYFVPPEQRYPGNLGGPPPLNIPEPDL